MVGTIQLIAEPPSNTIDIQRARLSGLPLSQVEFTVKLYFSKNSCIGQASSASQTLK